MRFLPAKREQEIIRLPLVALIDVCLFLLLYFMIAGTFAGEESALATTIAGARSGGGGSGSTLSVQVLRVRSTPGKGSGVEYTIGARLMGDRASLLEVLRALPKEVGMVIKVDDEAPVEAAAGAIQACKDAGFTKVTYVAGR